MLWRVVLQNLGTGNRVMRDMKDNLNRHLYGITEKMARWKLCLSQLTGSLAMALSSLYIRHHFNGSSRERVSKEKKEISICLFNVIYRFVFLGRGDGPLHTGRV